MAALTKNKLGLSVILMVIVCFISFPGLTMAASVQPANYQAPYNPFGSVVQNADFSVYASPSYLSATAGNSVNTTVAVMPRYSFNGTVSLSASVPAGWTATFVQSSLSLTNGYSGYYYGSYNWSTLSVAVPSDAAAGKYAVVVTGTSGSLVHSVNVTVNVISPDFRISASPSYLSVTVGSTGNSTLLVTPVNKFSGTVLLSASVPDGWTATFAPSSLSITDGYYGSASLSTVNSYYGYSNWSTLSVTVPSGTAAGKYTVVVTGASGTLAHSVNITVTVVNPDFQIVAYPSYLSATAGSTGNSTILLKSLNGFSGAVLLSASCPSGWTATFATSEISLASSYYAYYSYGGFNYSKLSLAVPSDAAAGKYAVVVTGTSGSLAHSVNVTVTVVAPDFRVAAYPSSLSVAAGSAGNSTIMVMPLYGFTGTVSWSASVPAGWTATFIPTSLSIINDHYGSASLSTADGYYGYYNYSTLSLAVPSDAAAGKYTIIVTGTNGSLTHSVNVTVNVVTPDFWIAAWPSFLSATAGSTVNSTILVAPLNGFNGTVSLSASAPAGWTASFTAPSLSLTNANYGYYYYGRFNGSTLSIAAPSGTAAGKYTIVVTGTSGLLVHSANVTVTVK